MDFSGSHKFAASPQQVWDALTNPAVLKDAIPGAQSVSINGNTIDATVHVNVPMLSGDFNGQIQIVSTTPPSQLVLGIDRSGGRGSIKGQATINLAPDGAGTNLSYDAHFDLGGVFGMANNPIGQGAAKSGLDTFFKNLEGKL